MKRLTAKQLDALSKVESVHCLFVKRFHDEKLADLFRDIPNVRPSEWVSVEALIRTHGIRNSDIKALVKKGRLEIQPTNGFGYEVRIAKAVAQAVDAVDLNKERQDHIEARKLAAERWAESFADEWRIKNKSTLPKTTAALAVIVLTDATRAYLAEYDPMALKQAQDALEWVAESLK